MPEKFEEEFCCILEICCGRTQKRDAKAALARKLEAAGLSPHNAEVAAGYVLDTFDLAPAGSLKAYRDAVAEMAREYPYQG